MSAPLRKIVKREEYQTPSHPRHAWSVMLTLECGHEVHKKSSECPLSRRRVRCWQCGQCQEKE